jgi:type IV pilus assembly protein PilA
MGLVGKLLSKYPPFGFATNGPMMSDRKSCAANVARFRVKQRGFSLIELLIVVAIILVISAIAIPSLLRSRMAANEASAVGSIRTITTAETAYAQTYPTIGYTCTMSDLGPPASGAPLSQTAAGILDSVLSSTHKQGYTFAITQCSGTPVSTYRSQGEPDNYGGTGTRAFCSDVSGVIKQSNDGVAATCFASGAVLQ